MNALVLSGGAAKGDGQAGAAYYLHQQGIKFHSVDGVSVGALNGTLIAQGEWEKLRHIWANIRNKDVYKRKLNLFHAVTSLLLRRKGILSRKPLTKLLDKHYTGKFKIPFSAGYVDLETGALKFGNSKEAVLASAIMPVIWDPVGSLVDGGLRDNTPLGRAVDRNPDHIYIIKCSKGVSEGYKNNLIGIAARTLNILLDEIVERDIKEFLRINELVKQAPLYKKNGTPYKYFDYTIIEPKDDWGEMLDFEDRSWDKGFNVIRSS